MASLSLLDKLWEAHVVDRAPGRPDLLYIDRHLIHEVTSNQAFEGLRKAGRRVRRPDLTCGVIDHTIPTDDRRRPLKDPTSEAQLAALEKNQAEFGIKTFFGVTDIRQGVIHVTMPEQGLILPGHSVVCGDSHTATHGALGALAFGIGTSEVEHVLATQTLAQTKPLTLSVLVSGLLAQGVTAKDLILDIINRLGVAGGVGHALEYRGSAVTALSLEGRLTLANMAIECGARFGLIAPDQTTFDYLAGRPLAPKGQDFQEAQKVWLELKSDPDHQFDQSLEFDGSEVKPRVTWGTNPAQSVPLGSVIPDPANYVNPNEREAAKNALAYQGLTPGLALSDVKVDYVFIGSCTNGRLEDLAQAAEVLKERRVKDGVKALVVPGSGIIKKQAEELGLAEIFKAAGCQWREPGCSMCLGMNPDLVPRGARCVSTSNRNFEGRQGRGSLTHLASPATAAAAAIAGRIVGQAAL
ncbi:MAG: 3-isopropylmalate dehydratase large subunit [Deltaproteobacteria bacterium]|jgi:3-isopropylmalate/(R)-2-methylmalate dehydratase large subunit|nr:3-isopropylmalate dehydratase large subunit [Deltaproteobacteria bacterium]